jgi:deoxyribodipyrimidine photo-lyase
MTGTLRGGRTEALRRLHAYDPAAYGRNRNHLDAPVSRLSPYLRHGMLSAGEVREHLQSRFPNDPARLEEFLRQLAWRDFFEKVLAWHGRGLDDDLEDPKHAVARSAHIPLDVVNGDTGLSCVDGILRELFTEGYLLNHARLWFAAYLCHFRGVRWQEGARLYRQFQYDGDRASNSSSWQWVRAPSRASRTS